MPDASRAPLVSQPAGTDADRPHVRELELIIRTFGDVVTVIDEGHRVIACDGPVEHLWGTPRDALIGEVLPTVAGRLTLIAPDGAEVARADAPSARALALGQTQVVPLLGLRRPDGIVRWAHVVAVPVPPGTDGATRVTTVWTDVTPVVEHDPAEDRVRERTAVLESTVSELEAFSYTVSHDLRAPARTIATMVDALLEETTGVGQEGRLLLERVRDTATRMDALTSVLLQLASIGRGEVRRGRVDLSAIASDELDRLRVDHPERAVLTRVTPGLTVDADEALVRTLLHNLLANAWKYTAQRSDALIEVGMRATSGERVFFVRDNGVGFEMTEAERIFLPFERLRREIEGTGVGLATVRRVVGRHGGRVWAEGAPGRGATFFFTLWPAPPPDCPLLADAPTPR